METTKKDPNQVEIVGGPSKFNFIASLSLRDNHSHAATFKIRRGEKNGGIDEIEVEIAGMFKEIGDKCEGEEHLWTFLTSYGYVSRNGSINGLDFRCIGLYSTRTRTGWLRPISPNESDLIRAAMGNIGARNDLEAKKFSLPKLARQKYNWLD